MACPPRRACLSTPSHLWRPSRDAHSTPSARQNVVRSACATPPSPSAPTVVVSGHAIPPWRQGNASPPATTQSGDEDSEKGSILSSVPYTSAIPPPPPH